LSRHDKGGAGRPADALLRAIPRLAQQAPTPARRAMPRCDRAPHCMVCAKWNCVCARSAELAGDVILCACLPRVGEDLLAGALLHELAHVEERGEVGYPRRLLQIVCDDDDGQ